MILIDPSDVHRLADRVSVGRYPCQVYLQVAWPGAVAHTGTSYHSTGKEGIRRADGMPVAEYEAAAGRRLWLGLDGKVEAD